MRLSAAVPIVLVLSAAGCGAPPSSVAPSALGADAGFNDAAAGAAGATTASRRGVPFKGTLQGVADPPVFEPPPSPFFSAHLEASGQATHLGRFTMDYSHRVNLETLEGTGSARFIAANGDELMTSVEGRAEPAGTPTSYTVFERHTVTGGTGRFAGASGVFTLTRAVDFADPFTSGALEGWISAPGSKF
jgi:hypothetical protein